MLFNLSKLSRLSKLSKLSKLSQTFQSQAKDYLNPFHNPKLLKQFFNFYPPYFGAGIRVDTLDFANHHIRAVSYTHLTLPTSELV